jgi:hypothetical protein
LVHEGGVGRVKLHPPDGPAGRDALARRLAELQSGADLILVDTSARGPALTAHLGDVVDRLVVLTEDTFGPLPEGAPAVNRVRWTALLGRMRLRPTGPAYRAGTARLRLDMRRLEQIGSDDAVRVDLLPYDERETVLRWARAVTDRRVGLALGGGGAWGYGHVALLRALAERGVPIDALSGASFGSVIGSYFAAQGVAGLDLAMERLWPTQMAISAGMLWLGTIERLVNRDLGGVLEAYQEVARRLGVLTENPRPRGSGPVLVSSNGAKPN